MLGAIGQSDDLLATDAFAPGGICVSPRRRMAHGQTLFAQGEARTVAYRVLDGAVCHYLVWPCGAHEVIEFAFPGDVVGLGFLADHISTAQAVTDTVVVALNEADLTRAVSDEPGLAARLAAAADREFEFVRQRALGTGQRPPLQRVASYLLAVARQACRSGEAAVVPQDARDGAALANLLEISAGDLAAAIADLTRRDLIAATAQGLVLKDAEALRRLADG